MGYHVRSGTFRGGPITDLELIRRVRDGDSHAYAEIIRRHHAAIAGLCLSILKDPAQAEDAAQEVFLKAYKSIARFRGDASLSSWLYRIASNHCLDALRRKARMRTESLDALAEQPGSDLRSFLTGASEAAPAAEAEDLVNRALDRLSPEHRLILTLREVQGLSYNELAETLECSLDAVKGRLKRARESMEEIVRHILEPRDV